MCGIVGIISTSKTGFFNKDVDLFNEMLYADALRGDDSTGVFGVRKTGNVNLLKEASTPEKFKDSSEYKKFNRLILNDLMFVVGHNRKATKGQITDENAHPFHEGDVILVHNGTLWDHKKHADVDVDSHAITILINEKGHDVALQEIKGAFALAWYDNRDKKLRLTRNKERPLWIIKSTGMYMFASEPGMLWWLASRNGYPLKNDDLQYLEPGFTYEFSLEGGDFVKVPWKEAEKPVEVAVVEVKKDLDTTTSQVNGRNTALTLVEKVAKIGDKVVFNWDDYITEKDMNKISVNVWPQHAKDSKHDMRVTGKTPAYKGVVINGYFNERKDWTYLTSGGQQRVTGTIVGLGYDGNGKLARIDVSGLEPAFVATSFNGCAITAQMWTNISKQCDKCQKDIKLTDVEDSYVSVGKTEKGYYRKKRIECPVCYGKKRERRVM